MFKIIFISSSSSNSSALFCKEMLKAFAVPFESTKPSPGISPFHGTPASAPKHASRFSPHLFSMTVFFWQTLKGKQHNKMQEVPALSPWIHSHCCRKSSCCPSPCSCCLWDRAMPCSGKWGLQRRSIGHQGCSSTGWPWDRPSSSGGM